MLVIVIFIFCGVVVWCGGVVFRVLVGCDVIVLWVVGCVLGYGVVLLGLVFLCLEVGGLVMWLL